MDFFLKNISFDFGWNFFCFNNSNEFIVNIFVFAFCFSIQMSKNQFLESFSYELFGVVGSVGPLLIILCRL